MKVKGKTKGTQSHGKASKQPINQSINQSINQIIPHNFFIRSSSINSFEEVHKHLNLLKFQLSTLIKFLDHAFRQRLLHSLGSTTISLQHLNND
jgi:hypothetical protein